MAYVYILRCADRTLYVGSTRHLELRVSQHMTGLGSKYTSTRLPVELVFAEYYDRVAEAYEREKQIQNWSHRKRMALIAGDFTTLHELSKARTE